MTKTMKLTDRMIADAREIRDDLMRIAYSYQDATRLAEREAEDAHYARQDEADLAGLDSLTFTPVSDYDEDGHYIGQIANENGWTP